MIKPDYACNDWIRRSPVGCLKGFVYSYVIGVLLFGLLMLVW
jgi:hypothetical protein